MIIASAHSASQPLTGSSAVERAVKDSRNRISLRAPTTGSLDGKLLRLRCCMAVRDAGVTGTFTPTIRWDSNQYPGSQIVFTNDTAISSFAAITSDAASFSVCLQAEFTWDSSTGRLMGYWSGCIMRTTLLDYTAWTTLTGITDQSQIRFIVTGTFTSAAANNTVKLTEFVLEQP